MPDDNRTQGPSNDALRDPLDDLIAPILGRDVTPEPRNVPTLRETSTQSRRNPLDELVTDAELRAEASKAAARSVTLNQGRRNPLDDSPRDAKLRTQSHKSSATSTPVQARAGRHVLKSAPVSVFFLIALVLLGIGVWVGAQFANRSEHPLVEQQFGGKHQEAPEENTSGVSQIATATFEKNEARGVDPEGNLEERADPRPDDGPVIKRHAMRPVSPPPNLQNVPPLKVPDAPALKPQELFVKASPSVVVVELFNARGQRLKQGSGFFVRDDSTVVTNYHVIAWATSAKVTLHDGTSRSVAGIEVCDELADVAVLKVARGEMEREIQPLQLEPNELPAIGSNVYVIGSPLGLDNTITMGIVSNNNREWRGSQCIQFDASISPGSSGSAMLNDKGIVTGIARGSNEGLGIQNVNFAAPAAAIATLLNENPKFQTLSDLVVETKRKAFDPVRVLLDKGTAKARDNAADFLDRLSASSHQFSEYWVLTGDLFQKRGQFDAAISAFYKAIAIDSEDSKIWHRIGLNHQLMKHDDAALQAFRKGVEVNPNDDDCWRGWGTRLQAARRLLEAKAKLVRAKELNPKSALNRAALGDVLAQLGDKDGAVAEYRVATELEPNDWLLWFSYGDLLQGIGRLRDATSAFEMALKFAKDPIDRELVQEELRNSRRLISR